jgi:hypothetical protein
MSRNDKTLETKRDKDIRDEVGQRDSYIAQEREIEREKERKRKSVCVRERERKKEKVRK